MPVIFGLQLAVLSHCPWVKVIGESNIVADKHVVFYRHPLADKGVAGYLTALANFGPLLNFNKGANFCVVTDFASIKVHKITNLNVFAKLNVSGDSATPRAATDNSPVVSDHPISAATGICSLSESIRRP